MSTFTEYFTAPSSFLTNSDPSGDRRSSFSVNRKSGGSHGG